MKIQNGNGIANNLVLLISSMLFEKFMFNGFLWPLETKLMPSYNKQISEIITVVIVH